MNRLKILWRWWPLRFRCDRRQVGLSLPAVRNSKPGKSYTQAAVVFLITCAAAAIPAASRERVQTISGRAIAYAVDPACLNGNSYWSEIVRKEQRLDSHSQFLLIRFSLPCHESPTWLASESDLHRFRLVRDKNCDSVLSESIELSSSVEGTQLEKEELPIWNHFAGMEHEVLPFGSILPCYASVVHPLAPVL
jgi:hypothetical protein